MILPAASSDNLQVCTVPGSSALCEGHELSFLQSFVDQMDKTGMSSSLNTVHF